MVGYGVSCFDVWGWQAMRMLDAFHDSGVVLHFGTASSSKLRETVFIKPRVCPRLSYWALTVLLNLALTVLFICMLDACHDSLALSVLSINLALTVLSISGLDCFETGSSSEFCETVFIKPRVLPRFQAKRGHLTRCKGFWP